MLQSFMSWIDSHSVLVTWMGVSSAVVFVVSLLSLPWLVSLIPEDYFCYRERTPANWKDEHPLVRLILLTLKNLLGMILLIGGIIMLIIPGQGLLTIIMGILLLDYPGKFQLERRIVNIPSVYRSLNWLRKKRGKPPLLTD